MTRSRPKVKGTHSGISFALAKGYVAWGVKCCWGNPVTYGAGLHRTQAAAKAVVENNRPLGWGIAWTISEEPVCLVRDSSSEFVFSLTGLSRLPELREGDTLETATQAVMDLAHTPIEPIRTGSMVWNGCKGPWLWWRSSSSGGASALYWEQMPQYGNPAPAARRWISKLKTRRASTKRVRRLTIG
jgi:hypothetical protein